MIKGHFQAFKKLYSTKEWKTVLVSEKKSFGYDTDIEIGPQFWFMVKSKFYKKRGATFFMTSHVSLALSTLRNIGQNHQVSSNLTSF